MSTFTNPSFPDISALLRRARVIAVVGLSADPSRPSHRVAHALQGFGYRIIPVTPAAPQVLGERAVADLEELAQASAETGPVDIIEVFRRPQFVSGIVDDCIRLKLAALWLQDGVVDEAAALRARAAGIFTVMDRCLFRDRASLGQHG